MKQSTNNLSQFVTEGYRCSNYAKISYSGFQTMQFQWSSCFVTFAKSYLKLDAVVWYEFSLLTKQTGQSAKDEKYYKCCVSVFTHNKDEIKPHTHSFL